MALVQPATTFDVLASEVADVCDRAAEGGQSEAQRDKEDLADRTVGPGYVALIPEAAARSRTHTALGSKAA